MYTSAPAHQMLLLAFAYSFMIGIATRQYHSLHLSFGSFYLSVDRFRVSKYIIFWTNQMLTHRQAKTDRFKQRKSVSFC